MSYERRGKRQIFAKNTTSWENGRFNMVKSSIFFEDSPDTEE
jgi:hypothetical protein